MSVVVQSQPEAYGLAHNDNPFVFFSTAYTPTQRFKVVVLPSTYPTDPALATVRVYPRVGVTNGGTVQLNKAYYDPSRIIQTQIAAQVAIPSANHLGAFDADNIHKEYALFIQEEDKVGGVYVAGASITTDVKSVWNGVINKLEWARGFDYEGFDIKAATSARRMFTPFQGYRYINANQSAFIYFLNSDNSVNRCNVKSYDSNGNTLQTGYFDVSITNKYGYVAVGTYDLENSSAAIWTGSTPSTIIDGASYYDVFLSNGNNQETVRYYIDAKCSKYEPIRLHWLNRLGGFDTFNFNLKSEEETGIKRASYLQEEHNFTGTSWEYNTMSRGTTDYHVSMQDKLTINTDFLTEAESVWMESFATSPVIYQEVNNQLIAMSGKAKMINKQTSLNDKLMQYTFELDYSLTNNRQRG
jgi:hypothetical protein